MDTFPNLSSFCTPQFLYPVFYLRSTHPSSCILCSIFGLHTAILLSCVPSSFCTPSSCILCSISVPHTPFPVSCVLSSFCTSQFLYPVLYLRSAHPSSCIMCYIFVLHTPVPVSCVLSSFYTPQFLYFVFYLPSAHCQFLYPVLYLPSAHPSSRILCSIFLLHTPVPAYCVLSSFCTPQFLYLVFSQVLLSLKEKT